MSWNYFWIQFATAVAATVIWQAEGSAVIAHKYVNSYDFIWNDKGSGGLDDVSIWRPVDYETGYYPLGDVAVATHDHPTTTTITVKELEPGALAPPMSFTEIWTNKGSKASKDVRILRMNPPNGYTCLGNAAINSYTEFPSENEYRCVKTSYVTNGKYKAIWSDEGTGAVKDIELFSDSNIGSSKAVFANTFTSVPYYHKPGGYPPMLNEEFSINAEDYYFDTDQYKTREELPCIK